MKLLWLSISLIATFNGRLVAGIIGTNPPAQSLTLERIALLPRNEQGAWKEYLARSARQLKADRAFLEKELRQHQLKQPTSPPSGSSVRSIPLDKPAAWYGSAEARRIADIVVSFQTPAGGWSKNLDLSRHRRAPGEAFAQGNLSRFLAPADNDTPKDQSWNYVGTFDNGATTTQLRYLAKVIAAGSATDSAQYRAGFLRGLDYIFAAQYPNGGWPQVWPLQGGYHDAITYNDGAMIHILELLQEVTQRSNNFAFIPRQKRVRASARLKNGLKCLLATQIQVDGRRTIWCQQHDMLSLKPNSARNYEMAAQAAGESAGILSFLMRLPEPSPEVFAAVHAGAAWFEKNKLSNIAFVVDGNDGRRLVSDPGKGPLWGRYYEIGSDRPIFGDRDKTIHDDVNEISKERRNGYAWFGDAPAVVLHEYAAWCSEHSQK